MSMIAKIFKFPRSNHRRWVLVLLLALVVAATWLPRGQELDHFATPDEPKWLTRSANFYQALLTGNFADTYQREHPGVTITWAGAVGYFWRYRDYAAAGPGQFDRPARLETYLKNHGRNPLDLLEAGRTFVVLGVTFVVAIAFLYAAGLLGMFPAFLGFILIALDPFFVALTRLLHLDGPLSALMLLSVLAYLYYRFRSRHGLHLLVSAAAAALSWLTKSPAFILIPLVGLLEGFLWILAWVGTGTMDLKELGSAFKRGALWLGVAALVFVLLWPAMWVTPVETLSRIFSQASVYAAQGHDSATFFDGVIYPSGESAWYFYPVAYLWRATPLTLLGLAWLVLAFIFPRRLPFQPGQAGVVRSLLVFGLVFTIFMTFGAKKFDRYLLPVFPALDLAAGVGWFAALKFLAAQFSRPHFNRLVVGITLAGLAAVQLAGVLSTAPYYLNYYNPLLGGSRRAPEAMMVGWGEGLDEAARHLNSLPGSDQTRVISWYRDGSFSYFFKGQSVEMDFDTSMEDLMKADYVVLYVSQAQRLLPSQSMLDAVASLTQIETVWISGIPYAQIYSVHANPGQN